MKRGSQSAGQGPQEIDVDETRAKQLLADMIAHFTAGSVLHLLGEVLRESAPAELDPDRAESLRDAAGMLFVVGIGLDAVWPGPDR